MKKISTVIFSICLFCSCGNSVNSIDGKNSKPFSTKEKKETEKDKNRKENMQSNNDNDTATFGGGCFWCTEAIFQQVEGVFSVTSGYSGGHVSNPTYAEVCTGNTGHAEVIQIIYNPKVTAYAELLEIFWRTHNPTTLNRQGADVGTQYRSVIFYHNAKQKALAEKYLKKLEDANIYKDPVVTEIAPFENFYKAEISHQDYYANNKSQPYCRAVITPKIEKFKKLFEEKLK